MIKIVNGDLLEAKENIIGHQVNCRAKMNSGAAKAIRNKYPIVFKHYVKECSNEKLGECQLVFVESSKWVANLFAQKNYGYDGKQYTIVSALRSSLITLCEKAKEHNLTVALPYKIGSDRGGADWNEVYAMIEDVFQDYEVTLYKK